MKILILSASVGAGHVRAGDALAEAAQILVPDGEVVHHDVFEFTSSFYRKAYTDSYLHLVDRNPALWGYLYARSDHARVKEQQNKIVRMFDRVQFARFRKELRQLDPDVVLATHFLPCQVLAPFRRRGTHAFPLGLVLTDFDAHALWVQPTADRFFVGSEEVRAVLGGKGLAPERIVVSGIPVRRQFARRYTRSQLRAGLDIEAETPAVLVMGGGHGTGAVVSTVEAALTVPDAVVLAVAGRNARLESRLRALAGAGDGRLRVFDFVTEIAELMAAADLIVTKSGGLTTAECLAMGLPMLVRDPTPGQEERNSDYLLEAGAALRAHGQASLAFKLRSLLEDEGRRRAMRRAARRHARPHAARDIVEAIVDARE